MNASLQDTGYVYAEIYLTFRCPYSCPYCINAYAGIDRNRVELSSQSWIDAISSIEWGDLPVTIGGGEPTLHKGFYEIIDKCGSAGIKFDILSNLTFDVDDFTRSVNPEHLGESSSSGYKSIRTTYHPSQSNPYEIVHKAEYLQESGFSIGMFGLNHPDNMVKNIEMSELCRKHRVYFFIKDYLGPYRDTMIGVYRYPFAVNGHQAAGNCRTSEIIVSPSGEIFRCHRDLYASENQIGHISEGIHPREWRPCSVVGMCNPCDVKLKTNRYFQNGHSSVEIKEVDNSSGN